MKLTQQSDRETYRAIVLGLGGTEMLLARAGAGFLLPSVEIPRWQRVAENMTVAIRNEWGQEAVCLFNPTVNGPATSANDHNYQVMECYGHTKSHPRAEWVPVLSVSERTFVDSADQVAVQRSLTECKSREGTVAPGPFARLGWLRELQAWIEEVIGPLGFHLTGSLSQLNASPSFSLVRFETSGPAVWFKAVGKPSLREFPITLEMARLLPQHLPPILATRPAWHGWLALEVKGTSLGETQDPQQWAAAASALANLQIASIDRSDLLLNLGARDLRSPVLSKLVRPCLDSMGQLMEKQTTVPPPVLSRRELTLLGERIEEALSLNAAAGIPDALGHLDLNPGNVIVSEGQCVFLDWAETYVGNPFFSFQYLVEHSRRMASLDGTTESGRTSAYAEKWQPVISPESIKEALGFSPMLAVFAYAAASNAWADQARLQNHKYAGYLRSLTRRMYHEADRWRDRSALCPN
jgi:hypothetical protein